MSEAIQMFGAIWSAAITLLFEFEILPGVSLGWLVIAGSAIVVIVSFLTGGKKQDG